MALKRLDNVAIVVADLDAAVAFFTELGMELEGRASIEGEAAAQLVGFEELRSDIAMMRMPGGQGRVELTTYHVPVPVPVEASPRLLPPNTLGMHRVMFAVDDLDGMVARLRSHGAEIIGEMQYEDTYRLCYLRGPEGIILALAEELG